MHVQTIHVIFGFWLYSYSANSYTMFSMETLELELQEQDKKLNKLFLFFNQILAAWSMIIFTIATPLISVHAIESICLYIK